MSFPVFWLPLLVAHTAAISSEAQAPEAAPQFASAVHALADQGYQVRDLQTRATDGGLELGLVLASEHRAQRLSVRFDEQTGSFSDFAQNASEMPAEERDYLHGPALLEELSLSAPQTVGYDCADFYLDFGASSVSLAEHAFEVEIRSTTRRPGAALSSWLRDLLEEGELVDIRDERRDDGAEVSSEVVFVIDGNEGVSELRVAVDGNGRAQELRLVHSPATEVYKRYEEGDELRRALRSPIESLNFVFGDESDAAEFGAIELEMRFRPESKRPEPSSFRIDVAAFEEMSLAGCGC